MYKYVTEQSFWNQTLILVQTYCEYISVCYQKQGALQRDSFYSYARIFMQLVSLLYLYF